MSHGYLIRIPNDNKREYIDKACKLNLFRMFAMSGFVFSFELIPDISFEEYKSKDRIEVQGKDTVEVQLHTGKKSAAIN